MSSEMFSEMKINHLLGSYNHATSSTEMRLVLETKTQREAKRQNPVKEFYATYVDSGDADSKVNHEYADWLVKNDLKAIGNPQREIYYDELPILEFPEWKGYGILIGNSLSEELALTKNSQITGNQLKATGTSNQQQRTAINASNTNQLVYYPQPANRNICCCGNPNCNWNQQQLAAFNAANINQPAIYPQPTNQNICFFGNPNWNWSQQQLTTLKITNTSQLAIYQRSTTQNICSCANPNCYSMALFINTNQLAQEILGVGQPLLMGPQYQQSTTLGASQPANFARFTKEKSCTCGDRNCIQATCDPKEPLNAGSYPIRAGFPPGLASRFPPPGLTYQNTRNPCIYAASVEDAYHQKADISPLGAWTDDALHTPVNNSAYARQPQAQSNFLQYYPQQSYGSDGTWMANYGQQGFVTCY